MIDIARNTALNILIEYDKSGVFPNLSLKKHLREIKSSRDKNFISALVYGVIEKRLLLDYYISKVSSVKIKKINVIVLNILRIGLYQLVFMSTPSSAACNTSVELAKKNGQYKSGPFVNAILRKLSQTYYDITPPKDYGTLYSIDNEIFNKLTYSLGIQQTKQLLQYQYDSKAMFVAVNLTKVTDEQLLSVFLSKGIDAVKTEYEGLVKINSSFDIEKSEEYKNGLFHVISLPSFIAARLVSPIASECIIDMCSAPGGKLFTMSYMCKDKAFFKAFDMHEHKIKNLKESCKRLSLGNITPLQKDCAEYDDSLFESADKILCDVPCSGLGMIFKKPDIKYNTVDFEFLTDIQYKILTNASKYLKKGGRLIYSTCTINTDENEKIIEKFLNENSDFSIDNSIEIYNGKSGSYTFLPHIDNTDGFFISVLKKQ